MNESVCGACLIWDDVDKDAGIHLMALTIESRSIAPLKVLKL